MKKSILLYTSMLLMMVVASYGQTQNFNLQQLLKEKKLETFNRNIIPITDGDQSAISFKGTVLLKEMNFSNGIIEIDLRGRDVFQQSFLGIIFHGVDTINYDLIYFRPFNFQSTDPVRKIHAVQYVSHPEFPWDKLREEKNGIYEKAVNPAPKATEWFHARIEVKDTQINVYMNHSTTPSLTVTKLNNRKDGLLGLWSGNIGENGDFKNLVIKNNTQ